MAERKRMTADEVVGYLLEGEGLDLLRESLAWLVQQLMEAEVSELTGYAVQRNKAIVGANAFAHEAGIHQDGLLKDVATYQIMDPAELGLTMTLPLGKHSGRHAFVRACHDAGLRFEPGDLDAAFRRFKELADAGRPVSLADVFVEVTA